MSVGIWGRIGGPPDAPGSQLVFGEPIACERVYRKYWDKAIKETGVKIFVEDSEFGSDALETVLAELKKLDDWAIENVSKYETPGYNDEEYIREHIARLMEAIPKVFEEYPDIILDI